MPPVATLARWVRKAATRPPQETARRAAGMVGASLADRRRRAVDGRKPTFELDRSIAELRPLLRSFSLDGASIDTAASAAACARILAHEFDLLGSGPVVVRHGADCPGIEGHRYPPSAIRPDPDGRWLAGTVTAANLREAQRIWRLIEPGYVPIDWQLDFRSGWRWSERTWYRDITFGHPSGADIKLPWELSRLQHLPQLAIAAALDHGPGRQRLRDEVRNQLLDFIATNPPRFGANWVTAMDVAIRVANVLLARDILVGAGMPFDEPADAVIRRSVFEHGRHIAENLEWDPVLRGNHYLSDQVGLLFASRALEDEPESAWWFRAASDELTREMLLQFNQDGSNFEGSTAYHGLSAELLLYGLAVIAGANGAAGGQRPPAGHEPLPSDTAALVRSIVSFSAAVTGPDGLVVQVGDNDSGRFFVADPWRDPLDQARLRDLADGLLPLTDASAPVAPGSESGPHRRLLEALSGGARLSGDAAAWNAAGLRIGDATALDAVAARIDALPDRSRATYRIPLGVPASGDVRTLGFPQGGYWVARSDAFVLVIRCGPIGQHGNGGHDHDDQLSFDLWIGNDHVVADPGTYVYTSVPEQRNRYRSASSHAGPLVDGGSPVGLSLPFALDGAVAGHCVVWWRDGFAGSRRDRHGRTALAHITWSNGAIVVRHGVEGGELHPSRRSTDWRCLRSELPLSPGYGRLAT